MEIGTGPALVADSLQVSYTDGRREAAGDLRRLRDARKLIPGIAAADRLARAYAPLAPGRAAFFRGRADVLAQAAQMPLDERDDLTGCVVACGACAGEGMVPMVERRAGEPAHALGRVVCGACGGAGEVYSPAALAEFNAARGGVSRG